MCVYIISNSSTKFLNAMNFFLDSVNREPFKFDLSLVHNKLESNDRASPFTWHPLLSFFLWRSFAIMFWIMTVHILTFAIGSLICESSLGLFQQCQLWLFFLNKISFFKNQFSISMSNYTKKLLLLNKGRSI